LPAQDFRISILRYDPPMTGNMREIVRRGYDAGDYPGVFRSRSEPNEIEHAFLGTLLDLSPANPAILDLGCGSGVPIDKYLAANGARLTGVDFSVKHLALAGRNVPSGQYIEADFSTADLGAGRFDAVVSLYAIFHIPRDEHKALLEKIARTLKEAGLFLATFGTVESAYGEDENWAGAKMAWSSYDPATYGRLLTDTGFEIVESRFEGRPGDREHHWWVLARRTGGKVISNGK
jgi:SAM-dependent methyltransferase